MPASVARGSPRMKDACAGGITFAGPEGFSSGRSRRPHWCNPLFRFAGHSAPGWPLVSSKVLPVLLISRRLPAVRHLDRPDHCVAGRPAGAAAGRRSADICSLVLPAEHRSVRIGIDGKRARSTSGRRTLGLSQRARCIRWRVSTLSSSPRRICRRAGCQLGAYRRPAPHHLRARRFGGR